MDQTQRILSEHHAEPTLNGVYLARVIDTNDPLNVGRVRIICPVLHDYDMEKSLTPWAIQSVSSGSPRAGAWSTPVIDDIVAVVFQDGNPNNPMWVGIVHPTQRRHYPILSQHQPAQIALDENANADLSRFTSDDDEYLPRDGRPMSCGFSDPYGNTIWLSGVGFFPDQHKERPAPVGIDPITNGEYKQLDAQPEINNPDMKFLAAVSKYGNYMMLSDIGYEWKKDGEYGEIEGKYTVDDEFEINRAKTLRRLFTQNKSSGRDQRRFQVGTRYGHMFLMSDVGWAQPGPKMSKSRPGEYLAEGRFLSRESSRDERWIKLRTKGGMLFQMSDIGMDPGQDEYITRTVQEDADADADFDRVWSSKEDARFMRFVTRYGYKIVLDDTGADKLKPQEEENPRAKGILIKGRRTGASLPNNDRKDNPIGFYFEMQERNEANRLSIGTPLGSLIELSDNHEYAAVTAGGAFGQGMPWKGLQDNEFTERSLVEVNPGLEGNMMFLDNENKFVMLRTRSGIGKAPDTEAIPDDVGRFRAGFEARDGDGDDGSWVEINDSDNRGIWMSRKNKMTVIRSGDEPTSQLIVIKDGDNKGISIYSLDPESTVQIFSAGDLLARSDANIKVVAQKVDITAIETIRLTGGGSILEIDEKGVQTRGQIMAKEILADLKKPKPSGDPGEIPDISDPPETIAPGDRGKRYN